MSLSFAALSECFGAFEPIDTGAMACTRRISATFKDVPGGQVLGPTFDYSHRLLDFKLAAEGETAVAKQAAPRDTANAACHRISECGRFDSTRAR